MRSALAFFLFVGLLPQLGAETWLVLPLFNRSGNASLDWIGESAAESITEAMAAQGALVVDREDRREAERRLALRPGVPWTLASILKLAETLDGAHVVYGSFELTPGAGGASLGRLKLRAEILNVRDFVASAKGEEAGAMEELTSLQTKLAFQVLKGSELPNVPSEATFFQGSRTIRVDAVENYVRGLLSSNLEVRQKFFEQALKLDGRYSQPAFHLGKQLFEQQAFGQAALWLAKVQAQVSHFREAGFLLGLSRYESGEYRAAVNALEAVAREVPLSEVYNNLGIAQFRSNMPEALDSLRRALDGDDKDPTYHFNLGLILLARGERVQAADQFRAVLDRDSTDQEATKLLGRSLRPPANPPAVLLQELLPLARPRYEFNESAYRQLKALMSTGKK